MIYQKTQFSLFHYSILRSPTLWKPWSIHTWTCKIILAVASIINYQIHGTSIFKGLGHVSLVYPHWKGDLQNIFKVLNSKSLLKKKHKIFKLFYNQLKLILPTMQQHNILVIFYYQQNQNPTLMCLANRQSARMVMKGSTSLRCSSSVATRRPLLRHRLISWRPNSTSTWMLVFLLSLGLSPPRFGSWGNSRQLWGRKVWASLSSPFFFLLMKGNMVLL